MSAPRSSQELARAQRNVNTSNPHRNRSRKVIAFIHVLFDTVVSKI